MIFKGQKAPDFIIIPAPRNNCAGCWFAGKKPRCTTRRVAPFVKQVFANNGGSCKNVIAVLNDEVKQFLKTA